MFRIAWHPMYCHPLAVNHRFPMEKYNLLPQQLLYEGTITQSQFFYPEEATEETLLLTHDADYLNKLNGLTLTDQEVRRIGFPLSERLIGREKIIMQGTIDAALFALEHGISFNLAGGTHHAFADRGEGFCLLNDMAVAANYMLNLTKVKQILIIDLDVHQGNGTAKLFENKPNVYTFSMHGKKNYPLHKEQSDLDCELEDFITDEAYLHLLDKNLTHISKVFKPEFVFYQAGVDILADDKLGRLSISLQGCKERDKMVFSFCKQNAIPLVVTMGGGYAPHLNTIIEAHANTFRLAHDIFM